MRLTDFKWTNLIKKVRQAVGHPLGADIAEYNVEKQAQRLTKRATPDPGTPVKHGGKDTVFLDPMSLFMGNEWLIDQTDYLSFGELRLMAKNPIIGSIVQTRLNQIAMFCRPSTDYEYGFTVTKQNTDNHTKREQKTATEISDFIYRAGVDGKGEGSLEGLVRKTLRDSLILDQACAEITYRRNGLPAYVVGVDGATIRKLEASLDPTHPPQKNVYAQVVEEQMVNAYKSNQMIYGIRNPQTDIKAAGYGMSELEFLINTITTLLNAERYNSLALAQGGTQKGVLVVRGDVNKTEFESFKTKFKGAIQNAAQTWSPPVIRIGSSANIDWITLDRANKDIEYSAMFEYIVKLATGVYQIHPEEINWTIGSSGANVSFNSGAKDRLQYSIDKGLRPLLRFLSNIISEQIAHRFNPEYDFQFTGLGTSRADEIDLRAKECSYYKTVNEIRTEAGLPLVKGGDIVLHSAFKEESEKSPANNAGDDDVNAPDNDESKMQDVESKTRDLLN